MSVVQAEVSRRMPVQDKTPLERGDAEAWRLFVQTHYPIWLRIGQRKSLQTADAEDAVQEALFRTYKRASSGKVEAGNRYHLYVNSTVVNESLDIIRARERKKADLTDDGEMENVLDKKPPLEDQVLDQFVDPKLKSALEAMPDWMREPVLLYDVEGFDYDSISHLLDIKVGTVRSRIHRGREKLRELLAA